LKKQAKKKKNRPKVSILFTCIGRRVSLLNAFRKAAKQLRIDTVFIGAEKTPLSPALQLCDKAYLVKSTQHAKYIDELLEIVRKNRVKLLVPTVDLDLKVLANNIDRFEKLGCKVLVSTPKVIDICQDKRKTYNFMINNDFDTPLSISPTAALKRAKLRSKDKKLNWPCFLKPWDGYASRGTAKVNNTEELTFFAKRIPNCIVQEYIEGTEYTCDVYVDFDMNVRCVVPRKRIEVRTGEVSKGMVVKNKKIMKKAAQVVTTLKAGPGVITIQLFFRKDRKIKFIEVNPRFGGGVPMSIKAGADFPKWILQELLKRKNDISFDNFTDGLTMLRYDAEVWLDG
jgi:carbamoyl-phosphate synthase large subunit